MDLSVPVCGYMNVNGDRKTWSPGPTADPWIPGGELPPDHASYGTQDGTPTVTSGCRPVLDYFLRLPPAGFLAALPPPPCVRSLASRMNERSFASNWGLWRPMARGLGTSSGSSSSP